MENITATSLRQHMQAVQEFLNQRVIGQARLVDRLLIALLADGHLLVEGAPGLAKTTAIKALSQCIDADFHRIQFTPDLLPGDITGTDIFRPQKGTFEFQAGPIFHNLILADEINRAPAKVQSALLEAMGEGQITVGRTTYRLPPLFMVMATQNPIEQEGTYPLPEAQLDRFLMYVKIGYPQLGTERAILHLNRQQAQMSQQEIRFQKTPLSQKAIFMIRQAILRLHMSTELEEYCIQLVIATRHPKPYGDDLQSWLRFGASPRGTLALDRAARTHAWLAGRDYVSPEDIHAIAHDVLRHRVLLSFGAEAEGISSDHFVSEILNRVAVP
jgi:MoxR-like ATPase